MNCTAKTLSNEHEQFHHFVQKLNKHFTKDLKNPGESVEESMSKFIEIYQQEGDKVESLYQLWNNESRAEDYKWNIEEKTVTGDSELIIKILEIKFGIPSLGGSSFTFLQTSAHTKSFCPVTDFFNGFYLVNCFLHENVTNIKGEVNFVNFTGFTKNKIKIHKVVFEMRTGVNNLQKRCHVCDDPERGYWIHSNNSWHWFTGSHVIPEADGNKLEQCLQRYSQVS